MKKVLILIAFSSALDSPSVSAQTEIVTVRSSDKKTIAKTVVDTKIDCPAHQYSLQLDRQGKQLLFAVDGQSRPYDLSQSKLGQDLLYVPTYGSYAFICGPSNVVLHFFGVEIKSEGPPVPVSYIALIYNDGAVEVPNSSGYEIRDYKALSPLSRLGARP